MGAGTGHSSEEEAAAGGKQVTTTHEFKKIEAGKYQYRGVVLDRFGRGFAATAFNARGWHRVGCSSLLRTCKSVDRYLDILGYKVESGTLRDPARFF